MTSVAAIITAMKGQTILLTILCLYLESFGVSYCKAADNSWRAVHTSNRSHLIQSKTELPSEKKVAQHKRFQARPLVNASQEELNQYALEMAYAPPGGVISGKPKVVIAKLITSREELYNIGLGKIAKRIPENASFKPSVIAIVKGNFNADAYVGGGSASIPVGCVIFGVEPETGFVGSVYPGGGYLEDIRRALKDPTFPKDKPLNQKVIREVNKAPRATPGRSRRY